MTTGTLTDEDGRKAQYTLTPNFGGLTMTVNTEEARAFDAEAFADQAYLDFHLGMFIVDAIKKQVQAAYEAGKRDAVPQWQPINAITQSGDQIIVGCWDDGQWCAWETYADGGPLGASGISGLPPTHFHLLPASPKAGE